MLKFCVLFSGVTGSSKTPIANYLSTLFGLPVLNTDAIRTEIKEDLLIFDEAEFTKRRDERIAIALNKNNSFIYDASIDRVWEEKREEFYQHGYNHFIISLDLSKAFLKTIYKAKGSTETEEFLNTKLEEHKSFSEKFSDIVTIHIDDNNFPRRLEISAESLKKWIESYDAERKELLPKETLDATV